MTARACHCQFAFKAGVVLKKPRRDQLEKTESEFWILKEKALDCRRSNTIRSRSGRTQRNRLFRLKAGLCSAFAFSPANSFGENSRCPSNRAFRSCATCDF